MPLLMMDIVALARRYRLLLTVRFLARSDFELC